MAGESREVSKNPLARAPEVGGNMLRGLLAREFSHSEGDPT